MKNKDAVNLFWKKENKELLGRKKINIVLLSVVFFLSVLSIAFACACLSYLGYKMNDKFVNCIDIVVDQTYGEGYDALKSFLYDSGNRNGFGIESQEEVYLIVGKFVDVDSNRCQLDGRTCTEGSPILNDCILSEQNIVDGKVCHKALSNRDLSIIVSIDGLKKLGLDTNTAFLEKKEKYNNVYHSFFIPIHAVVKELPDMCDFVVTEAYYKQEFIGDANESKDPFDLMLDKYNENMIICVSDSIKDNLIERIEQDGLSVHAESYDMSYSNDYSKLIVGSQQDANVEFFDSLFCSYSSYFKGIVRIYDFDFPEYETIRKPQLFSCFFKRESMLENVENFRNSIKTEVNYGIDMSKIYSLKNLIMVQRMGNMLSVGIIVISIIFLCAFIYFLLRSHFQKIQMNLGTFKAFGISNRTLVWIYLSLMVSMLVLAFAIAFIVALVVAFVMSLFTCIEQGYPWLDVSTWQNWVLFGVAVLASVVTTLLVTRKLLIQTPGDLIYQRKNDKQ